MYYAKIITYFRNNYKYVSDKIKIKEESNIMLPTATSMSFRLLLLTTKTREKKKKVKNSHFVDNITIAFRIII